MRTFERTYSISGGDWQSKVPEFLTEVLTSVGVNGTFGILSISVTDSSTCTVSGNGSSVNAFPGTGVYNIYDEDTGTQEVSTGAVIDVSYSNSSAKLSTNVWGISDSVMLIRCDTRYASVTDNNAHTGLLFLNISNVGTYIGFDGNGLTAWTNGTASSGYSSFAPVFNINTAIYSKEGNSSIVLAPYVPTRADGHFITGLNMLALNNFGTDQSSASFTCGGHHFVAASIIARSRQSGSTSAAFSKWLIALEDTITEAS